MVAFPSRRTPWFFCVAVWISVSEGIVPNVGIHIPTLWVFRVLTSKRSIRGPRE